MADITNPVFRYPYAVAWNPPVPNWARPDDVEAVTGGRPKVMEIRLAGIVEQVRQDDGSVRATSVDGVVYVVPAGFAEDDA
ncbi:hypothetical protein VH567_15525 [Sphingomonas sp. 4RDLI-65]|uniref:hypothetical protein n=1 Tax=Sphingomonas sp. 4RDLI-65 TaxID=3111641 RepID=UPI003C253E89